MVPETRKAQSISYYFLVSRDLILEVGAQLARDNLAPKNGLFAFVLFVCDRESLLDSG